MAIAPLRFLTTGFPSLPRDCLQQCHYPLLPMYTLHELENDVFEKEFYAKVFVPAKTSPQGWFFVGPPMPTRDLAIQQVAYEALLRLRDLLPEMKEEHATRYLPGKSGFGAPTQVMISQKTRIQPSSTRSVSSTQETTFYATLPKHFSRLANISLHFCTSTASRRRRWSSKNSKSLP